MTKTLRAHLSYLKKVIALIRAAGLSNVFFYSLFRIMPKKFALLASVIIRGGASGITWGDEAFKLSLAAIFDYKSWSEMGGNTKPARTNDQRECFIWFVPDWRNVWGGGHYTLFRFANRFAHIGNSRQIIFLYDNQRHLIPDELQAQLDEAVPDCKLEVMIDPGRLPSCTVAMATTWQSAYSVRAFPFAEHKFYFMQDYESQFYAYGTTSVQANNSYNFGFKGITGGQWLKSMYKQHGGSAENYIFSTDRNIFYPENQNGTVRPKVTRLFFYGRPSTERRCFDLGIASLSKIAKKYPDVEIVVAGLDLNATPPFAASLLGNLSLKATGDLYRSCDIGLAFSGTNLSYLPVELMACGVPVISNNGPQVEWYCKHLENSYLVDPTPSSVLEAFDALYESQQLRQKLVEGGLKKTAEVTWESEIDRIHEYVQESIKGNIISKVLANG